MRKRLLICTAEGGAVIDDVGRRTHEYEEGEVFHSNRWFYVELLEKHPDKFEPYSPGGDGPQTMIAGRTATDAAIELARECGLDIGNVAGTGKDGRITLQDVRNAADGKTGGQP